jgi:hypothetical protein
MSAPPQARAHNPHTNSLNVYIQIANKMGFQQKKKDYLMLIINPQGDTSTKTAIFIVTVVKTSNPTIFSRVFDYAFNLSQWTRLIILAASRQLHRPKLLVHYSNVKY